MMLEVVTFRIDNRNFTFPGLNTSPNTLKETMIPNISPETVADTKVQVSGGYDPCQFGVSIYINTDRGHYFAIEHWLSEQA